MVGTLAAIAASQSPSGTLATHAGSAAAQASPGDGQSASDSLGTLSASPPGASTNASSGSSRASNASTESRAAQATGSSCGSPPTGGTAVAGGTGPPCGCQAAGEVSGQRGNVTLRVYLTPDPHIGDEVCLFASVVGGSRTSFIEFTVTNSTGGIYLQIPCILASAQGGGDGRLASCQATWNTNQSYQGKEPVGGVYRLYVTTVPYARNSDAWVGFTLS